jgi:carboxylesterase
VAGVKSLTCAPQSFERGTDEAVLLVHGLGGGPYEVQRLAEALPLTSRCVVLPGHEVRSRRMPDSTWPEWSAALEREFDALAARHRVVHLVGFSTGAPLVLQLARTRPNERTRLVLLAPFFRVYQPPFSPVRPEALLKLVPFLTRVPRRRPPLRDRALRAEIDGISGFRTFSLSATRSALELIAQLEPSLPAVQPLIIQGKRDTVVDPAGARVLHERLPGSVLELVDSDHLLTLDVSAPQVIARAVEFLGGQVPSKGELGTNSR